MKLKDNAGKFENAPPGNYRAVCFKIVDLGTQEAGGRYPGKKRKLLVFWEIDHYMQDGRKFMVSTRYTASLAKNAILRAHLESWRTKAFTDEELKNGFDPRKLLGQGCMLNLIQNGDFVNVSAVMGMPKGADGKKESAPECENAHVYFSLDDFDQTVFDGLSDTLKDKIMASPEYQKLKGINTGEGEAGDGPGSQSDPEADIPF